MEYEDAMYNYALPDLVPAPQGWMDPDFPPMATSLGGDLTLFPGQDRKMSNASNCKRCKKIKSRHV